MLGALWGADHTELGEVAVQTVGADTALAISRGARPKAYAYVDPNEDAVAAVVGSDTTMLAAIDGHNGYTSTEVGMSALLDLIGEEPPANPTHDELIDLFRTVSERILDATQAPDAAHPESRAAIVVAFVSGRSLRWAGMGDAPLYRVGSTTGSLLMRRSGFIGFSASRDNTRIHLQTGEEALDPGDWVIAASDGFSDFPSGPSGTATADAAAIALASQAPADLARRLVENAFEGGAGDNVAVAVTQVAKVLTTPSHPQA